MAVYRAPWVLPGRWGSGYLPGYPPHHVPTGAINVLLTGRYTCLNETGYLNLGLIPYNTQEVPMNPGYQEVSRVPDTGYRRPDTGYRAIYRAI